MSEITVICEVCAKIFTCRANRPQRYCSQKCAHIAQSRPVELTCKQCGSTYTKTPASAKKSSYCSRECQNLAAEHKEIRICPQCGIEFVRRVSSKTIYCSKACTGESQKREHALVCKNCRKSFVVRTKYQRKFCSNDCYDNFRHKTAGLPENPAYKGAVKCACRNCGKAFYVDKGRHNSGGGVYCSLECRKADKKPTPIELTCELCGKTFYKTPAQIAPDGYGRFCSQSCRSKATIRDQYLKSPTSIERLLIDEMLARNVAVCSQYVLDKYVIDFAFPEQRLAVEADGVYWHSLPNMVKKDARKDRDLARQGWTVLHFTGDQIRESPSACVDQIVEHLNSHHS